MFKITLRLRDATQRVIQLNIFILERALQNVKFTRLINYVTHALLATPRSSLCRLNTSLVGHTFTDSQHLLKINSFQVLLLKCNNNKITTNITDLTRFFFLRLTKLNEIQLEISELDAYVNTLKNCPSLELKLSLNISITLPGTGPFFKLIATRIHVHFRDFLSYQLRALTDVYSVNVSRNSSSSSVYSSVSVYDLIRFTPPREINIKAFALNAVHVEFHWNSVNGMLLLNASKPTSRLTFEIVCVAQQQQLILRKIFLNVIVASSNTVFFLRDYARVDLLYFNVKQLMPHYTSDNTSLSLVQADDNGEKMFRLNRYRICC